MKLDKRMKAIFEHLDMEICEANAERKDSGGLGLGPATVKILGQTALLLADIPFPLVGTMDLDAQIDGDPWIVNQLRELLLKEGIRLDSDARLIWMPPGTKYAEWFESPRLQTLVAEPDAVIASKAKFQRLKDRQLIRTYLDYFPEFGKRLVEWGISVQWVKR